MPMLNRHRAGFLLLLLFVVVSVGAFAQNRTVRKRRAPSQLPSMAALVDAVKSRGEDTVLSGYVAVVMDLATDFLEQVPAKAIALKGDATHSRLLCLVNRKQSDTIVMVELADGYITAYAMTTSGVLKKAAHGPQFDEFELIPQPQATAGFQAAKEFWLHTTNAATPPRNKSK